MGQVQNQAYGYFFPHGAFFALGDLLQLPPWIVQRLWWALLLTAGFVGVVRLAEALRVGSPTSRIVAGAIFALSPRVLTTLGSISSETLPMMLAPWVLLPVVRALDTEPGRRPLWREAARSAAAVALMGAVNAVATLAALGVAVLWWMIHAASTRGLRWLRFGLWWAVGLALACAWWLVPLLILSRVSPPFLDYIESSGVTTQWTSLTEVLRGTSSWTPFVSSERVAGAVLVAQPAAVLATGTLAAAGLAGLCMRHMPFRGPLVIVLAVGLMLMCVGFAGQLGSPIADDVRAFLDGPGAALRNIHKFEPLIRLPLALGVAHLLARVPLPGSVPWRTAMSAFAHPQRSRPVAAAIVVLVAMVGAGSLMWTGQLTPAGAYREIPRYWQQTSDWLADHSDPDGDGTGTRALVVPGAPFADQLWGLTRDEPMQPLARSPWAVRDAIPLTPPGAIRAMDSVQRAIAAGRGSPGLAATLAQQGIGYVVLRADLDPDTSRSARPLLVQQALLDSPGLHRVAVFGPQVSAPSVADVVRDNNLRPPMPAVQIFAVDGPAGFPDTGPVLADATTMPTVTGGPEALAAIADMRARMGLTPLGPAILDTDARRAGVGGRGLLVTDTPADRETDFGRVDDHSSAIRAVGDPRRTRNAVADYPVDGAQLVRGEWLLDNQTGQVRVYTSGSAADATQPGQTSPANSAAAAFDGDPHTAWASAGLQSALGQSMRIDFTRPRSDLAITLTTAKALGPDVTSVLISTEAGSTVAAIGKPGTPVTLAAPGGATRWVQIRAIATADGTAGNQFALAEVGVGDLRTGTALHIRHRVVLPELTAQTRVTGWLLTQELAGRPSCVDDPAADVVRCAGGLGLSPETPGLFTRALSVPQSTDVTPTLTLTPRPGDALNALLRTPRTIVATGSSSVTDPRGGPSAAVDGDPRTVWTAPEAATDPDKRRDRPTTRPSAADRPKNPQLVLNLPAPQPVTGLELTLPQDYPAAPTKVSVDLGTGAQVRSVPADGRLSLRPATTDRIAVTILDQRDLVDVNSLGFASPAPPGIAEIAIVGGPPPPPADDDRVIDVDCAAGIGVTVSGQVTPMTVRTTVGALRNGHPVVAKPCAPQPVRLAAGQQELTVNPSAAFSVDAVSLDVPESVGGSATPTVAVPGRVLSWSATDRSVQVPPSDHDRVIVVPESTNDGWQARLGDAQLTPIVVNGWQQGWLVPANTSGTLHLTYRFDELYRWALVVGLLLMAALLIAAAWPVRADGAPEAVQRRQWMLSPVGPGAAAVGVLGLSWLLAGWWGVAIGIACAAAAAALRPRAGVVAAFVAMMTATVGLAARPWHAADGYHGFAWWVQAPALVSVLLTIWLVVFSRSAPASGTDADVTLLDRVRASSLARSQRRAGSSRKA